MTRYAQNIHLTFGNKKTSGSVREVRCLNILNWIFQDSKHSARRIHSTNFFGVAPGKWIALRSLRTVSKSDRLSEYTRRNGTRFPSRLNERDGTFVTAQSTENFGGRLTIIWRQILSPIFETSSSSFGKPCISIFICFPGWIVWELNSAEPTTFATWRIASSVKWGILLFPVDFRKKSSTNSLKHLVLLAIGHSVLFFVLLVVLALVAEASMHQFVPNRLEQLARIP